MTFLTHLRCFIDPLPALTHAERSGNRRRSERMPRKRPRRKRKREVGGGQGSEGVSINPRRKKHWQNLSSISRN